MNLKTALKSHFGFSSFKSQVQEEAIQSIQKGLTDIFVLMPTGSGKSLCYQLPGLLRSGVCIVFSPLLSLINDQVRYLRSLNIPTETLNSKISLIDRRRILDDLTVGPKKQPKTRFLFVTPETAGTDNFQRICKHLHKNKQLSYVAVDEAHCVAYWGREFRPDYLKLGALKEKYPEVPWIALTATATERVIQETCLHLRFRQPVSIFKVPAFRSNLFYETRFKELLTEPVEQDLINYLKKHLHNGSAIIYCRTKDGCSELAKMLNNSQITAAAYHAGLPAKTRTEVQTNWMNGSVSTVVATISFAMGVDKADVRVVVHWTLPPSVTNYYQETGRAGRDGKKSYCLLYYSRAERDVVGYLISLEFPRIESRDDLTTDQKQSMAQAMQHSFEKLVYMFQKPGCKHVSIAQYFGDEKPACQKMCDYCFDPKACTLMQTMSENRSLLYKTNIASSVDGDGWELYGGGRYGEDSQYGGENDSSLAEAREEIKAKRERMDLIREEFDKRRTISNEQLKLAKKALDREFKKDEYATRLIDFDSDRIKDLLIASRLKALEKITDALKENMNHVGLSLSDVELENQAKSLEYSVFTAASKTPTSYNVQLSAKLRCIKNDSSHLRRSNTCDKEPVDGKKDDTTPRQFATIINGGSMNNINTDNNRNDLVSLYFNNTVTTSSLSTNQNQKTTSNHCENSNKKSSPSGFCKASDLLNAKFGSKTSGAMDSNSSKASYDGVQKRGMSDPTVTPIHQRHSNFLTTPQAMPLYTSTNDSLNRSTMPCDSRSFCTSSPLISNEKRNEDNRIVRKEFSSNFDKSECSSHVDDAEFNRHDIDANNFETAMTSDSKKRKKLTPLDYAEMKRKRVSTLSTAVLQLDDSSSTGFDKSLSESESTVSDSNPRSRCKDYGPWKIIRMYIDPMFEKNRVLYRQLRLNQLLDNDRDNLV